MDIFLCSKKKIMDIFCNYGFHFQSHFTQEGDKDNVKKSMN